MTREEALSMPKDKLLSLVKKDYETNFPLLERIELVYSTGQRSAVGNKVCIEVVKKALLEELDRQIAEATGMNVVEVTCYGKKEVMTREEALSKYREGVLCCEGSERERYLTILLALERGEKKVSDNG